MICKENDEIQLSPSIGHTIQIRQMNIRNFEYHSFS